MSPVEQSNARERVPLLKFESDLEKPHLHEAGLAALAALPPPVSVVSLLGDGRCGKSTLASRLVDDQSPVFPAGSTGLAVTEGIDMCIVPRSDGGDGSLVILDCEGGNNPTGAIRSAVDLVALLASTLTLQVVWGQMSEAQLLQIGQSIADCDRLLLGNTASQRLPAHQLLLVVNGCHLEYSPDHITQALMEVHSGASAARNELRANIKRAFKDINFITVPFNKDSAYFPKLEKLRGMVVDRCKPSELGGAKLSGAQIAEMLKTTVSELRKGGAVPVPSVFRHVIYDHMLKPLVTTLVDTFDESLPDLADAEYRPSLPDTRGDSMTAFDSQTKMLHHVELVSEARDTLRRRLEAIWQRVHDQNAAIGEQDRDVSTESEMRYSHSEDRVVSWKRGCLGIGKTSPVVEPCSVFRIWTRTRVLKKNGVISYSDWCPSSHSMDGSSLRGTSSHNVMSTSNRPSLGSMSGYLGERTSSPAGPLLNAGEAPGSPLLQRSIRSNSIGSGRGP